MAEPQSVTPVQPPSQAVNGQPPKKTSPWIWVIGGCVVLLIVGALAFAGCSYFGYRTVKKYGNDVNSIYLNTLSNYSSELNSVASDTNSANTSNTVEDNTNSTESF